MAKRIDRGIARQVLDEVDDEDYLAVLRPLIKSKRRQLKPMSDYETTGKLVRFAMSRGFTIDLIRQCLDGADEVEIEEDEE